MATRLKTVQFAFPALASLTNNTLTNLTQITVFLPEATKTFRDVWLSVSMDDIVTATGGTLTTKTINLRLGAAAYTSTTNGNTLTNSAENLSYFDTRDFTAHFTTNWTGTSMTCDVQLQINQSTGTTLGMVNVCAILYITYEYDDAATTQIKTVSIPLNAPATELPTAKTSHDTIPELRSYLPEANKVYRNMFIVTQANTNAVAATDHTVSYEISSLGVTTTGNYESALLTSRWVRYVYSLTSLSASIVTATQTFNMWASLAARHHTPQAWMVVTYEFDASVTTTTLNGAINSSTTSVVVTNAANIGGAGVYYVIQVDDEQMLVTARATNTLTVTRGFNGTTAASHANLAVVYPRVMQSLLLPLEFDSPMGGTAAANFQRAERDFWVPEISPTFSRVAALVWWIAIANEAGLNARIGSGTFVAYTNTGSGVVAGSKGLMIRNDAPTGIALGRGRNNLFVDLYNTSATQRGGGVSVLWLVNYTARLADSGHSAHSHTASYLIHTHGTGASVQDVLTTTNAPLIPETDYFISALGMSLEYFTNGTTAKGVASIVAERLVAEGGLKWERIYSDAGIDDAEVGQYYALAQIRALFNRWTGDADTARLAIETNRRYRVTVPSSSATTAFIHKLAFDLTYHSITYAITGRIKGSAGGTVTVSLHRTATGEKVLTTTVTGNATFSFTWYDDTEEVYVMATESATLRNISASVLAPANVGDINLRDTLPLNAGWYS